MSLPARIPKSSDIIAAQYLLSQKFEGVFGPGLLAITYLKVCVILEGRKPNPKPATLSTQSEPSWRPCYTGFESFVACGRWVAFIKSMA